MPILDITLLEGRDDQKKGELIRAVTDATVRSLGVPPEAVRVLLREISPSHFAVAGVRKSETS